MRRSFRRHGGGSPPLSRFLQHIQQNDAPVRHRSERTGAFQTEFGSNCCRVYAAEPAPRWSRLDSFVAFLAAHPAKPRPCPPYIKADRGFLFSKSPCAERARVRFVNFTNHYRSVTKLPTARKISRRNKTQPLTARIYGRQGRRQAISFLKKRNSGAVTALRGDDAAT